ncbi:MAG TPA: hypothetical protein VFS16_03240 [Acidimicrobiia bacterium]|nr:hypothetical protein [Acidimicrobiia bacterium]
MTGPGQVRRRFFLLLAPLVCAVVAVPAARTDAAEGARVPDAEVAEALQTIQVIAGDVVSSGTNKAKAAMIAEGVDPIWERIEATIKANDPGSYETLEKGLVNLAEGAGDPAKAGGAAGIIASAVKFYVAKFPGDGKAAAPAPASAGDRTAAAASTTVPAERPASDSQATPAPADGRTAAADTPKPAEAEGGTLARTGVTPTLTALAGGAFGLGGLSLMAGARRRSRRAA